MNNKNSIGIHIIGLDDKESAIFNRVIAFNVTHGLIKHDCSDTSSADLIILSEAHFSGPTESTENTKNTEDKTLLVVSNDSDCQLGDFQATRPLLITRVMKTLQQAFDFASLKSISKNNETVEGTLSAINDTPVEESIVVGVTATHNNNKQENNHHALVIDDSAAIRKQLELELRDANISADFAESGEQALEMIKNTQYDLIFLDIIMPGIDGYETCKTMRSITDYKKTPIIMLSGKT
ncbi:MAG: response regulator, partial [Cocleimonas sp.]